MSWSLVDKASIKLHAFSNIYIISLYADKYIYLYIRPRYFSIFIMRWLCHIRANSSILANLPPPTQVVTITRALVLLHEILYYRLPDFSCKFRPRTLNRSPPTSRSRVGNTNPAHRTGWAAMFLDNNPLLCNK